MENICPVNRAIETKALPFFRPLPVNRTKAGRRKRPGRSAGRQWGRLFARMRPWAHGVADPAANTRAGTWMRGALATQPGPGIWRAGFRQRIPGRLQGAAGPLRRIPGRASSGARPGFDRKRRPLAQTVSHPTAAGRSAYEASRRAVRACPAGRISASLRRCGKAPCGFFAGRGFPAIRRAPEDARICTSLTGPAHRTSAPRAGGPRGSKARRARAQQRRRSAARADAPYPTYRAHPS